MCLKISEVSVFYFFIKEAKVGNDIKKKKKINLEQSLMDFYCEKMCLWNVLLLHANIQHQYLSFNVESSNTF